MSRALHHLIKDLRSSWSFGNLKPNLPLRADPRPRRASALRRTSVLVSSRTAKRTCPAGLPTAGLIPRGGQASSGLTIIETIVTIAIIGIISSILLVGYPSARDAQALKSADNQIATLLREAQQRALNEQRDQECLDQVDPDTTDVRRCSNVGLFLTNTTVGLFADLDDNGVYSGDGADFNLKEQPLTNNVRFDASGSNSSFLFNAAPPVITLTVDGTTTYPGRISIHRGKSQLVLTVGAYGQLGRE